MFPRTTLRNIPSVSLFYLCYPFKEYHEEFPTYLYYYY